MQNSPKRFTITAALPYTNGPVHIGHLAGVYVPADIYSRFQRIQGNDVAFVCGSDEHGVPITIKAKKEGITPQQVVDKYHAIIKQSFQDFGITFDNYSRTTAKIHHDTASEFFKKLYEDGKFIEQTTEQFYDKEANQFLADRFILGTCPKCGFEESYGDQCESCGTSHNATDLINPKSSITGNTPSLKKTKHWFLPLDQYEPWLKDWIVKGHKKDWKANVYGQCKSWIDDGLRPRAVTRDLDWGIPVPVEGADGKVLYVWFDAPIGYISATKEWAEKEGKDWEPYWKDENTKLLHFIGKDNIVFHCIIFPSMLKAEGSYIVPNNVPANEFLNLEGNKISTSKNWAVWLHEYLIDFPNQQDVLRYTLTANAPETKDNDFTWSDFQARNNNELVAIFGNFINRVVVLTNKYYDGIIPEPVSFSEVDIATLTELKAYPNVIESSIERYRFREYNKKNKIDFSEYPYRYIHFRGKNILGHAIFSKYPLINTYSFDFEDSYNNTLSADLVKGSDTLRIYNIHLQSLSIKPSVSYLQEADNEMLRKKISIRFIKQQEQVETILEHKNNSRYPVIISGDFNNTPFSYVYHKVSESMNDAFVEAGNGIGATYLFEYYPMRIDYILASNELQILSFNTIKKTFSDHYPIRATIGWD